MSYFKNLSTNNKLFLILIILILVNYFFFNYRLTFRQNGWITGDWLINYQGGFVRRGFIGEIIFNFAKIFNLSAKQILNLVFFISSLFFFLFIYFFYLVVKNYLRFSFLFLYLFLPSTLLFTFFDVLAVGRKDSFILLYFSLYSFLLIKNKLNNHSIKILLFILIFIFTLSHELIFFFTPYLFAIKFFSVNLFRINFNNLKIFYFEFLLFFSSLSAIILLSITSSSVNEILICNSLIKLNLNETVCGGTIFSGLKTNIDPNHFFNSFILSYFFEKNYFKIYGLIILLNFIPIFLYFFFSKKNKEIICTYLFYIIFFFICFFFTFPVFLIVNDWGRYLNIHFINHALIFTFMLKNLSDTTILGFQSQSLIKKLSITIIVFFYLTTWFMPHCCSAKIGNGYNSIYSRIYGRLYDESHDTHKYGIDYPRLFLRKILNLN